ncbi:MAG TPA: molybdopterin-dependent oxidoreductase, partial [Gemmataceae bacterium]|nr:molybdopterin-dependent oxidoreductase [Gemmataceae bacterium]
DEGRFGYHYINGRDRIRRPLIRSPETISPATITGAASSGIQVQHARLIPTTWENLLPELRANLAEAARRHGPAVAGVLSPFLTCEEAFLLAKYLKGLSGEVHLALGPVPTVGEDDTYPKDRRGRPVQAVKFTIHAEKCPNRRGVEEILRHFQGKVIGFDDIVHSAKEGRLQAVYLAAAYPPRQPAWISEEQAAAFEQVPLVILQDLFESPISRFAHYVIPAASFAEKDGTFVNHQGLAQAIHRAIRPPQECRTDGQAFLDLAQRRGLVHAPTLRAELAREVPYFEPLSSGELGEYGVLLQTTK